MVCLKCKKEIPEGAFFCPWCGFEQKKTRSKRAKRPISAGSITRLSGKRTRPYLARLPAEYGTGTVSRPVLGCYRTYKEADAALAAARNNRHMDKARMTLKDIYDQFTAGNYYSSLSAAGQASHKNAWNYLKPWGSTKIHSITTAEFQAAVDDMQSRDLKRETLAKVRNLASLLCKECMRMGIMPVNYGALVQLPREVKADKQPFSANQLKALWTAADSGDRDAMAILVLCYTGMRPGELLGVRIEKHMHSSYFQTGSKTEAGRNRIIPIAEIIKPLLTALQNGRAAGPLIAAPAGGEWRLDNWRKRAFRPAMNRLGITGATPYTGRHTFADIQKRRSVDPEIIMEIMGHEDYSTTVENYHTTTKEDITRICEAVDGLERPA